MTDPVQAARTADIVSADSARNVTHDSDVLHEYETFLRDTEEIETKDLNLVRDGDPELASGIWDAEMKSFIDAMSLKTMFFTEDWVFIVVDLIASKLSHQPLRVMKRTIVNGKKKLVPDEGHPVQKLLESPNLYQDQTSFVYTGIVDLCVLGNTIIWHSESTNQLIGIPAELVRLDFDRNGFLSKYMVQQWWGSETNMPWKAGLTFDSSQIIHVRRPNPSSLLWGLSPLIPGRKSILFNRYSTEFLVNFYLKGATPQMSLEMDKEANEKNALRLLRSFENAYTGRKNQRRTLVLPKGVKANPLTQTLADQQLKDYININRETIINLLKVPKHELSLAEAGSLGSEEAKQAMKNFWESMLKPTGTMFAGALTKKFALELGPDHIIEFDLSDVEVLRDDEVKKAELAKSMLNTHTLNEVRATIYELAPLPEGDATPKPPGGGQQMAWGKPVEPKGLEAAPAKIDPEPEKTMAAEGELTTPEDRPLDSAQKSAAKAIKTGHDGWFNKRQGKVKRGTSEREYAMHKLALSLFVDTAHASVKVAKRFLQEKGFDAPHIKADGDKVPQRTKVINKAELRKALRKAYSNLEEKWVTDSVKILEGTVDLGYDVQLDVPFKLPSRNELEALRQEGNEGRRATLEDRELQTFARMSETTTDKIMSIIDGGVADGKTVQNIAEDIASSFRDIENIDRRAMVIARTETMTALSMGQAAALEDASTVMPNLRKMWVSTHDDRTRGPNSKYGFKDGGPDHENLDGETVAADEKFSNGLQYPRDPSGPADEVIQCRCAWVMIPEDQKA